MPAPVRRSMLPFLAFLALFYCMYPLLARSVGGAFHNLGDHWPIAVAMSFGSFFAGATPVGGGSVAFPILVMLLDQPVAIGREFSWAIQSLGMTAAALFVIGKQRPINARFLLWACVGSHFAAPPVYLFIIPHASPLLARLVFASLWCGFGLFVLGRLLRRAPSHSAEPAESQHPAELIGIGAIAAMVACLIGGGADMVAFCYLTLRCRTDARIAIPTAMMLMAANSIIALTTALASRGIDPGVWPLWLAAAPIVVIGAPVGAWIVTRVPRSWILCVVALLCIAQFLGNCRDQSLPPHAALMACAGVAVVVILLTLISRRPQEYARRATP